jgi:methylated-DNA-[protein]-cysteine S-methyltransferase
LRTMQATLSVCFRSTSFGPVGILWSEGSGRPRIHRVVLSRPEADARRLALELFPDAVASSCSEVAAVAADIVAFLGGDHIRFSLDDIRLDGCSGFQQQVLRAEHAIPRGMVSTYRRIAVHLGKPKGARAVGNALARNPFPIIIPCHRAVRSDGRPGGYQGGPEMKRALLVREGIAFDEAGRVRSARFFY